MEVLVSAAEFISGQAVSLLRVGGVNGAMVRDVQSDEQGRRGRELAR